MEKKYKKKYLGQFVSSQTQVAEFFQPHCSLQFIDRLDGVIVEYQVQDMTIVGVHQEERDVGNLKTEIKADVL